MDRSTTHLLALMLVESLVVAVLGYFALVAETIDVMTMVYVVVALSIVTGPRYIVVFRGREEDADAAHQ